MMNNWWQLCGNAKLPLVLMHGSLGILGLYLLYGWLF